MGLRCNTLIVCVLIILVVRGECLESDSTTVLPAWTIHDCPLPSQPGRHPVSLYRPHWLSLKKQVSLSPEFWLSFYGITHNMEACGLRAGVVYRVVTTLPGTLQFHEQRHGDATGQEASDCKDEFMVLDNGSYGFVSCAENGQKATEAAWTWWGTIPTPYITIVLISVGVAMGVVLLVGLGVGVAWRRRSRGGSSTGKSWKYIMTTSTVVVSVLLVVAGVVWIVWRRRITKILGHERLNMVEYSHEETGQNEPLQEGPRSPRTQQRKPVPSQRTVFLQWREFQTAAAHSTTSISSIFSFGTTTTMSSSVFLPATPPSMPTIPSFSVGSDCTLPEFSLRSPPELDTHGFTMGQVFPTAQPETPPAVADVTLRHSTRQQQQKGDSEEHVYERATYLFDTKTLFGTSSG